jgi:hypothetical protein
LQTRERKSLDENGDDELTLLAVVVWIRLFFFVSSFLRRLSIRICHQQWEKRRIDGGDRRCFLLGIPWYSSD